MATNTWDRGMTVEVQKEALEVASVEVDGAAISTVGVPARYGGLQELREMMLQQNVLYLLTQVG